MPTGSTLPDSVCLRSLTNVSVIAVTLLIGPLSQRAVSMQWAKQVAGHAAAGGAGVDPPQAGAALRQVGRDRPVLQEVRAVVKDAAEPAFVDELLGERDGRHAAVVVPHRVRHARLLDGGDHLLPLGRVHRQRLLAEDHLAGLGRGDRDVVVQVVRHADVDRVDVRALDQLPPIGFDRRVAPRVGKLLGLLRIARTQRPAAPARTRDRRSC